MKKIRMKKLPLLLATCAVIPLFGGCNYYVIKEIPPVIENVPTEGEEEENELATFVDGTKLFPPPESGDPLDYTGAQNVSFMAYQLINAPHYRLDVNETVTTKIAFISYEQKVQTYKDYADGVMIAVDISNSIFVNLARQTCEIGDKIVTREAASSDTKTWNARNTAWSTKEKDVTIYTPEQYKQKYGLPYTAFSVYSLSDRTIDRWTNVTQNSDGTYTQTVYPSTQKATEYYSVSMKNNGGLTSMPKFKSIAITYTFDANWRVLRSETKENYGIEMSVIKADDCSAVTYQTYDYTTAADVSDYEGYFKKYF